MPSAHQAHHLRQACGEVEVHHQQVAAEHAVGNVGILQHAAQSLNHHHAFCHLRRRFRQGIHLVHRGHGKLDTALLQLQIRRTPSVQQRFIGVRRQRTLKPVSGASGCQKATEKSVRSSVFASRSKILTASRKASKPSVTSTSSPETFFSRCRTNSCRITKVFAGKRSSSFSPGTNEPSFPAVPLTTRTSCARYSNGAYRHALPSVSRQRASAGVSSFFSFRCAQ